MKVKQMNFPPNWKDKADSEQENVEIFVTLENDYTYRVRVATPKNLEVLMEKEQINYVEPSHLFIVVTELTKDIIEETIQAYAEENEGYWLKSNHFAGDIDTSVFHQLQAADIEDRKELDEFIDQQRNKFSDS